MNSLLLSFAVFLCVAVATHCSDVSIHSAAFVGQPGRDMEKHARTKGRSAENNANGVAHRHKHCDFNCRDLHPSCDDFFGDVQHSVKNCSEDLWKNRCPRTCGECVPCDISHLVSEIKGDLAELRKPKHCDKDTLMVEGGCCACYSFMRSVQYMGYEDITFMGPPGEGRLTRIRNFIGTIQDAIVVTRFGEKEKIYGGTTPVNQCGFNITQDNPVVKVEGVMENNWSGSKWPVVRRLRYTLRDGTTKCDLPKDTQPETTWNPPLDGCFVHGFYGHAYDNTDYLRGIGVMWACPKMGCH